MDFEKFIEEVKSRIKDFLPEKYADAEIYVHEQKKINSQYTGLTVVGKNIANPIATILSAAMMLEYSFGMKQEAQDIRNACQKSIEEGVVTEDLAGAVVANGTGTGESGAKVYGTTEVGEYICKAIAGK